MYHPTRGGTRGGAAQFSWDDVKKDKDRENYLGHSILAPTGRWQKNKDVTWYNKDKAQEANGSDKAQSVSQATEARKQELMAIKMREEEEMNKRLGIKTDYRKIIEGSSNAQKNEEDERKTKELESGFTKEERKAAKRLAKMEVRQQRRDERDRDRRRHKDSRDSEDRRERHSRHANSRTDIDQDRRRSRSPDDIRSHRRSEKYEDDRRDHRLHDKHSSSSRRREGDDEEHRRERHRSDGDQSRRRYRD